MAPAAPNNSLACGLIPLSVAKQQLGVKTVKAELTATSPTAEDPSNQHTVNGADVSECDISGFSHKPSPAELKALHNARKPVPPGFGVLFIETYVRDDTPNGSGQEWEPTRAAIEQQGALVAIRKHFGGATFKTPALGSDFQQAAWLGSKDRTSGFYEVGDSLISLGVNVANGRGPATYNSLAKKIVPAFAGLAP